MPASVERHCTRTDPPRRSARAATRPAALAARSGFQTCAAACPRAAARRPPRSTCERQVPRIVRGPHASPPPPDEIPVGTGRGSKTLTRVLSATAAGQQLKVPDDRPAQINNELPGTKGSRAAPTALNFHRCRHPAGKAKLTGGEPVMRTCRLARAVGQVSLCPRRGSLRGACTAGPEREGGWRRRPP